MSLINILKNCNICDCNNFLSYILVFCNWRVSWLSSIEQAFKIKMSNNKTTYLLTTFLGCFWQMSDWIFFFPAKKNSLCYVVVVNVTIFVNTILSLLSSPPVITTHLYWTWRRLPFWQLIFSWCWQLFFKNNFSY